MLSLKNAHTAEIQNCSIVMTINECFSSSGEMFLRENVIFEIYSAKKCLLFCASCRTFNSDLFVSVDIDVSVTHPVCSSDDILQEFNIQKRKGINLHQMPRDVSFFEQMGLEI